MRCCDCSHRKICKLRKPDNVAFEKCTIRDVFNLQKLFEDGYESPKKEAGTDD